jgi:PPOX class probable F420-dependent enzyme
VIEGGGLLIYSGEASTRIGNLEHNPRVAVNSRGDRQGDTLVTMEGRARIDRSAPAPEDHSVYLEKYGAEIERLGWTPRTFSEEFPVALRITIDRIRTW